MSDAGPSWVRGLDLLRERQRTLPAALRGALSAGGELPRLDRCAAVVTTGVGSSLAHARYLAWLLRTRCGVPSWDAPSGAWIAPPEETSREQALVVFSQGLSPNARLPLEHAARYRLAVLVTAADLDAPERAACARSARERGVVVVQLGCGPEYEVLLRVIGPLLGYAVALRLANAAGAGVEAPADAIAAAVTDAAARMAAQVGALDPAALASPVTLVSTGGYAALAHNLAAKVQEGMLLQWPAAVDALELAHGTLQEASGKQRTFVALTSGACSAQRSGAPSIAAELLARARASLEPQHRWLEAAAQMQGPLAIFEHEVMVNELVLAAIGARRIDQREWPGKGRDGALYGVGSVSDLRAPPARAAPAPASAGHRLCDLTWPEVEGRIAAGARTVVVPLGACEQHGPHLPLQVDALIADALAERFCALVEGALYLPALALGCSGEHLSFAGTVSLSADTLLAVLGDVIASLVGHGFDRVVVFSAHGGNDAALAGAEAALRARAAPAALTLVHGIDEIGRRWQEASAREGIAAGAAGHHAGEFETSIVAGLRPELVRWRELRPGLCGEVADPQALFYPSLRDHAPEGVVGDPRAAAGERAERYLAAWVDLLVAAYRRGPT